MAKPSRRVAARQAELSRRKRQHRPLSQVGSDPAEGSSGAAVAEPAMEEMVESSAETGKIPAAPPTERSARPETARPAQPAFRQPSFRSASRAAAATRPDVQATTSAVGRPMPKNPYQGRDLRAIGIFTTLLLGGLIVLKLVL